MLQRLRYFWATAAQSIRQTPGVQGVAVSTIAVALVVLGVFLTVLLNIDRLSARWGEQVRIIAFLSDDADADHLAAIGAEIADWREVEAVETLTREVAFKRFRDALGDDAVLLDGVDATLMPASVEVTPTPDHRGDQALAALADRLRAWPGLDQVEDVAYGRDLIERVRGLRDLLRLAGVVIGGLVLFAMIFIVSNTVRLSLFARREEVEIMQLVGATDGFIRGPYYIEGALQGLAGGVLATGLLWGLYRLVMPEGERYVSFGFGHMAFDFLPVTVLLALVLGAAVVGVIASHVSVGRFLRDRALDEAP